MDWRTKRTRHPEALCVMLMILHASLRVLGPFEHFDSGCIPGNEVR